MCVEDYTMVTDSDDSYFAADSNNIDDAMLSSAVDSEKLAEEGTDTDFLKDLDDLTFTFDDPCCEVAMEDSFQDFIDSALDQSSYPPFLSDASDDKPVHCQSAVILNKEQFLETLQLKPAQEHGDAWATQSASFLPNTFSINRLASTNKTSVDVSSNQSQNHNAKPASFCDMIPTRQCSCVDSVFKAVYSTAHPPQRDCVRTCPSTLVTCRNFENNDYLIPQSQTPETSTPPVFIDLSPRQLSDTSQVSTLECLSITIDDDTAQKMDNDTADIMKWLSESQHGQPQHSSDSNNNNTSHGVSINESVSFSTEISQQSSFVASSFDFESFVDLDDLETEMTDRNEKCTQNYPCERTVTYQSKVDKSGPYISQLKLSLLTEHLNFSTKHPHGSLSDAYSDSSLIDKLSPKCSDLSYCDFSPSWSRTDSTQSAVSPATLASMDVSLSSNLDDTTDDSLAKSPFALLNLFSDENATSLLHNDTAMPNLRFM